MEIHTDSIACSLPTGSQKTTGRHAEVVLSQSRLNMGMLLPSAGVFGQYSRSRIIESCLNKGMFLRSTGVFGQYRDVGSILSLSAEELFFFRQCDYGPAFGIDSNDVAGSITFK